VTSVIASVVSGNAICINVPIRFELSSSSSLNDAVTPDG
jgi:hypothetical protein